MKGMNSKFEFQTTWAARLPVDRRDRCAGDQIENQRGHQASEQNDDRPEAGDLVFSQRFERIAGGDEMNDQRGSERPDEQLIPDL